MGTHRFVSSTDTMPWEKLEALLGKIAHDVEGTKAALGGATVHSSPNGEASRLRSPTTHEHRSDECSFLVAGCWSDVLVSNVLELPARP